MAGAVRICTASSSATANDECRGQVLVCGSYGGEYNAFHAGKWGLRGVILNDAGVGRNRAGIRGLAYLDRVALAAAAADAATCHIGDAEHMLEHGVISHVNTAARALGCAAGTSVRQCAERMKSGPIVDAAMPEVHGGRRVEIRLVPKPAIVCLDAAPMLKDEDAGAIVVTGSHAALFRGRPDGVIRPDVKAIFFSDASVGLDQAGIARLPTLDARGIVAGCASVDSAEIGDAQSIYRDGILSHVNRTAASLGGRSGMRVIDFVSSLSDAWRESS